jgi:MoxR-like ATPase
MPKDVNRGKVIDELRARRKKVIRVKFEGGLVGEDLGYGEDWRKYENQQGYSHFEELLLHQPEDWKEHARECLFKYKFDVNRGSSNEKRRMTLAFPSEKQKDKLTVSIHMTSPVLLVMLHPNIQRSNRYEPLNFLLAYGATNPLTTLLDTVFTEQIHRRAFLAEISPLDFFLQFQRVVQSYKLKDLQKIGKMNGVPRLGQIKELDFSMIIGQRLAKRIVRQVVVKFISERTPFSRRLGEENLRPLSMIFTGPSGTGKTGLAEHLATLMGFVDDNAFIKIDCGERSDNLILESPELHHTGSDAFSMLNNFLQRMARRTDRIGVVLLDGIEMAQKDMIRRLARVLETGEWTIKKLSERGTAQAETVPCSNVIIIMTTNVASARIRDLARSKPQLFTAAHEEVERLEHLLQSLLRMEIHGTPPFNDAFVGRVDKIVPFFPMPSVSLDVEGTHPLLHEKMTVAKMMIEQQLEKVIGGVTQEITAEAKHGIAKIIVRESVAHEGVRSIQRGASERTSARILHSLLVDEGGIKVGRSARYDVNVEESSVDLLQAKKSRRGKSSSVRAEV